MRFINCRDELELEPAGEPHLPLPHQRANRPRRLLPLLRHRRHCSDRLLARPAGDAGRLFRTDAGRLFWQPARLQKKRGWLILKVFYDYYYVLYGLLFIFTVKYKQS